MASQHMLYADKYADGNMHTLSKMHSNESVSSSSHSWTAKLDETVDQLKSANGDAGDKASMARFASILGPKVKILSNAPWEEQPTSTINSRQPKQLPVQAPVASPKAAKKPARRRGLSESHAGSPRHQENGRRDTEYARMINDLKTKDGRHRPQLAHLSNNVQHPADHLPTSAPAEITSFQVADEPAFVLPDTPLSAPSSRPYKLISLEEARRRDARQREATRSQAMSMYFDDGPSSPAPTPPTLKTRKSGFLKRMIGNEKLSSSQSTLSLALSPRKRTNEKATSPSVRVTHAMSALSQLSREDSTSTAVAAPAPSGLLTPVSTPSNASGRLAPSLALRPVSMAFSARLPTELLAKDLSEQARDAPVAGGPASITLGGLDSTAQSPLLGSPSPRFDEEVNLASSAQSASSVSDSRFRAAEREWVRRELELEKQIDSLRLELAQMKAQAALACDKCGHSRNIEVPPSPGMIERPRLLSHSASRALFG